MSFLNPAGLYLLAAIPLIVLLHLFRQERRRQEVSSLFLWRQISDQHSRRIRPQLLRNINLLLQILFAILASIALAQPEFTGAAAPGSPRMIVLVDTSASMSALDGQVSRLDIAKNRSREIVGRARRDTEVMVATAGPLPAVRQGFTHDRSVAYDVIRSLETQDGPGDVRAALAMIRSMGDTRDTEVVFVTDGAIDADDAGIFPARFRTEFVGSSAPNRGITAFELRRRFDGSTLEAYLEIANFGPETTSVTLELLADSRSLSRREVLLDANEVRRLALDLPGVSGTVFEAVLVGNEDALSTDDVAHAVAGSARPLRVQLVTEGNYFLESILSVYPNVYLTITTSLDQSLTTDLFVLDSVEVPAGITGSVLAVNTVVPGGPFEPRGHLPVDRVVTVNRAHPVAVDLDLATVTITRLMDGDLSERALVVASAGTTPAIYTFARDNLRLVALQFSLAETDLGLRSSFPVLMSNAITWLAPSPREAGFSAVSAGTSVPLLVTPGTPFVITDPSGDDGVFETRDNAFSFRDTMKAGIYRISGASFSDVFAVTLTSEAESRLDRRFAPPDSPGTAIAAGLAQSGRPFWQWLIGMAALLLVVDWIIWARRT